MTFGLEVVNDNNRLQINGDYLIPPLHSTYISTQFSQWQTGYGLNARRYFFYLPMSLVDEGYILAFSGTTGSIICNLEVIISHKVFFGSDPYYGVKVEMPDVGYNVPATAVVTLHLYRKTNNSPLVSGHGINIFDSAGECIFNSEYSPFKIRGVFIHNPSNYSFNNLFDIGTVSVPVNKEKLIFINSARCYCAGGTDSYAGSYFIAATFNSDSIKFSRIGISGGSGTYRHYYANYPINLTAGIKP